MNYYESMLIFDPDLTEKEVKEENDKIIDLIAKSKGDTVKTDYIGRRTLAYLIKKKREGYYLVNYFQLPPTEVGKIERYYLLADKILRFNLLTMNKADKEVVLSEENQS